MSTLKRTNKPGVIFSIPLFIICTNSFWILSQSTDNDDFVEAVETLFPECPPFADTVEPAGGTATVPSEFTGVYPLFINTCSAVITPEYPPCALHIL